MVDATDNFLDQMLDAVPIDMLQLHGRETPQRVAEVKARYGLPVMKAVGIESAADLPALDAYGGVADQIAGAARVCAPDWAWTSEIPNSLSLHP